MIRFFYCKSEIPFCPQKRLEEKAAPVVRQPYFVTSARDMCQRVNHGLVGSSLV